MRYRDIRAGSAALRRNGLVPVVHRILCSAVLAAALAHPSGLHSQSADSAIGFKKLCAEAAADRQAGHTTEAIEDYRHALALNPNWEEGWWYLGTLNYDSEQFEDARTALRKVVQLDGKLGAAWAFLGLCDFELRDYKSSFTHLQRAQGLGFAGSPEVSKVALYHLALLLNVNGEFEKSIELLVTQFGSTVFPDQIKSALGLALLRVPLLPNQVDPAKDALIHAAGETAALLANHRTEEALQSFEHMVAENSGIPYLHYAYGMALASASRYNEAESQFRQEANITTASPLAWLGLTSVFLKQGRGKEAAGAARHAVQVAPKCAGCYDALARALQMAGRNSEAATARLKAKAMAGVPVSADALQRKRYAIAATKDASSVPAASAIPERRKETFEELARRAESAQAAGNLAEAGQFYQAASDLRPDWAQGWRMIGTFAYMDGRFPEAITALKRSVTLDARPPEAWTVLGLSEFETKDFTNALIHLKRGSEGGFGGNSAAVQFARYHLALLLNLNGEFDQALNLLIPVVGAGPPSEDVQFVMGISLLRLARLPQQIQPAESSLVRLAGRAAALLSESRYDQAFPIFEQLIREHPETPFLHFAYGSALASSSNYDRARDQLLEETRMNPSSALSYVRLASISLVLHQPEEALQFSRKAVEIAPGSAEPHYVLGRSLLELGDAAAAVAALETSRRLAPGSPEVHFNLARAYTKVHRPEDADVERAEFERLQAQNLRNSSDVMNGQSPRVRNTMPDQPLPKRPAQ